MAIFGYLELENVVQANDKTRLSAIKSYISKDNAAITQVRIKPSSSDSFVDVTGSLPINSANWYLDWQYASAGTKTVTLEITAGSVVTFTKDIDVVTDVVDNLFSSDQDLTAKEPDILKWVPQGRNSWMNVHRAARDLIIDWLDSQNITKNDGSRLEPKDILVSEEVKQLSAYWTLALIFEGLTNRPDDIFRQKADKYYELVNIKKGRGRIQADLNGDAVLDRTDIANLKSGDLVRR